MRNPITTVVSGVGRVIGNIFGVPLDFLSGKSCSSVCGPTWDVGCYIENFCIQHLLKFFAVSLLLYLVLLLLYFLYKLKVFHCLFKTSFKMIWGCFSRIFLFWDHGCRLLCGMLHTVHERRKSYKRDIEMANMSSRSNEEEDEDMETSVSYHKEHYRKRRLWTGDHKRNLLRKSLRAQNHRVHVGVDSVHVRKRKHINHDDVRVIRTSSFAKKGPNHKRSKHQHKKE
ncbi:hypothetical protein L1987_66354 [Smallanthus sonchifolius]|uniref:Uncharacterized protein n=1 Tax=Smallanthus sonchifolius TaxID=185202 RepID=A0ACB9BWW2_9ASTR|nr:hypothetical protein L1987_66354 [Smallanthus sonchifolius]